MEPKKWKVTGMMSGTSLDGLDIAACEFSQESGCWKYSILAAQTVTYPPSLQSMLEQAMKLDAVGLAQLDADLGTYYGQQVSGFNSDNKFIPDFISSHGHTVFHSPANGFTVQVGRGSHIAAAAGLPVVCDFRSTDVAMGGQGAPLVPIGDSLLFPEYNFCLNLGGIANISFDQGGQRIAFDICPVNMALNYLAQKLGNPFDDQGKIAASGKLIPALLDAMDDLEFYRQMPPRSLGREWFDNQFLPLISLNAHSPHDILRTCAEHIAGKIAITFGSAGGKALVTGGGAWNSFLLGRIRDKTTTEMVVPNKDLVNFKEALIFAFLGLLRWRGEPNCLKSVTGASRDVSGGCIYLP